MQTFKQVLIRICEEETVNRTFISVFIFILTLTNMFLCYFQIKGYYMSIAFAGNPELYEYMNI